MMALAAPGMAALWSLAAQLLSPSGQQCATDPTDCQEQCRRGERRSCLALAEAVTWACDNRRVTTAGQACYLAAELFRTGTGVELSLEQQALYLEKACDLDMAEGCNDLGAALAAGRGIARDDARAIKLWEASCRLGSGMGCFNLGGRLRDGRGMPRDLERALTTLARGCELKNGGACFNAGNLQQSMNDPDRGRKASSYFEAACRLGDDKGCARVGGSGSKSPAEVKRLGQQWAAQKRRECEEGWGVSCGELGNRYVHGDGVRASVSRGLALYQRACLLGFAPSCHDAGLLCRQGRGTARDPGRAARYFVRACELAYNQSCLLAGQQYLSGEGVAPDRKRAAELFGTACKASIPTACEQHCRLDPGEGCEKKTTASPGHSD